MSIKSYRQLGGIQKGLESARNQLQMLKTATAQRERGLNMLAELENKGVSLDVVYELSRVLDLQKIAKELSARTDPWSNMDADVDRQFWTSGTHKNATYVLATNIIKSGYSQLFFTSKWS